MLGSLAVAKDDYSQAGTLEPMERRLLSIARTVNEGALTKQMQSLYLRTLGRRFVQFCSRNLLDVKGLEHAHALKPSTGVLLCSNHRSFFDMYVISSVLLTDKVPWYRDQFFPVRSNFFYDQWVGMGINMLIGGGVMYPPIFRDRSKAALNKVSVERVIEFLRTPGVVVGMHPEGTRGKGPDPHELLRAQPGVGQMALQANVPVVPAWISGLQNNWPKQVASNFAPGSRRGEPIVIRIGKPVDLDDLREKKGRVTLYKRAADRILDDIRVLGEGARDGD